MNKPKQIIALKVSTIEKFLKTTDKIKYYEPSSQKINVPFKSIVALQIYL
jgi:hypothetical protein